MSSSSVVAPSAEAVPVPLEGEVVISNSHGQQLNNSDLRMALATLPGSRELESITVRKIRAELAVHLGLAPDGLDTHRQQRR